MKTLILTVGLPRSGKTTWARQQSYPIVNPDSIRLALHGERFIGLAEKFVWAIAQVMVRALFLAGHDTVILDATNTTDKRRDEWISTQWNVVYHVVPTSRDECIARAEAEGDEYIKPIIDKMALEYQPLANTAVWV